MKLAAALVLALTATASLLMPACGGSSDSPAIDAAPSADAALFMCSQVLCEENSQFCYVVESGADPRLVLDAGTTPSADAGVAAQGCNEMPAACRATPTCACLTANTATTCASTPVCNQQGAQLTVTCPLP